MESIPGAELLLSRVKCVLSPFVVVKYDQRFVNIDGIILLGRHIFNLLYQVSGGTYDVSEAHNSLFVKVIWLAFLVLCFSECIVDFLLHLLIA